MNCLNNCTLNSFIIKYSHKFNTTQTIIKDIIKSLKAEAACCVDCEYECAKDTLKEIIKSNHLYRIFKNVLTCELELLLDYICGNINDVPTYDLQFFNGGNTTGCSNDRVSYSFILTNFSSESVPVGTTFNLQWTGLGANPVFSISTDQSFYSSATISNDGLTITIQEVINTFDMQNENIAVFLTVTFDNIGCGESEITLSLTSDNNYNITTEPATQTQTYIPQQMYSCSGNTCVEDENGQYDHPSCYGNCNGGGGQMYSCVEGNCVPDNNGQYNNNSCNGNCNGGGQQTMYSCSGGTCVEDANGIYNDSNCYSNCIATYSCDGNTCIEDINGTYYTTNCDYACEEPVLLGFIELDDIANTPVPGNSAHDWSNYVGNYQAFTSTVIIGNKIEFYGIPMLNIHLAFSNITLVDYDFSGFTYLYSLIMDTVNGLSTFNLIHTNLQAIYLYNVDIITLDLSGCINLNILTVSNALMITSININNNTLLNGLQLYNIPLVTGIDFTNNLALTSLSIEKHGLTSIDITLNTALNYLRVYNNNNYTINSIDLSNNINLNVINIVGTNIVSLDISNILDLTQIDIHNNLLLSSIDITNAPNLTVFDGSNTAITSIDTSNNSLLYYLNLYNTPIVGIDTSLNTVLGILNLNSCSNLTTYVFSSSINTLIFNNLPQFTTVDISGCVNLRTFDGSGTPLSNINITNNPLLNNIRLFFCAISDVNNINALLAYLVSINYTGYLDISGGTNAAPTGQGILDVATLISNGATIITN